MVWSFNRASGALAVLFALTCSASAQQSAYSLLPPNTQAVVWIRDSNELLDRWDQTQLAKLTADEEIAPFFDEKREEIKKRLMDAGWRINIQPEDLGEFSTGQVAIAWCNKPDTPVKPYALALIADVADDAEQNEKMLETFEQQLDPEKAQISTLKYKGVKITNYGLPPRTGEFIKQKSYLAIVDGLLLAADEESLVKELIDRSQGELESPSLAEDEVFVKGRELAELSGHVEAVIRKADMTPDRVLEHVRYALGEVETQ